MDSMILNRRFVASTAYRWEFGFAGQDPVSTSSLFRVDRVTDLILKML